jgi:hypothetical protein
VKILGREVEAAGLLDQVRQRLEARGEAFLDSMEQDLAEPIEPRVDPVQHHLEGLERHSDPTQGLPLHTHRTGLGRAVLLSKWLFRKTCQPLIHELLGRQRLFNAHTRDAYAELAARVEQLTHEVESMRERKRK